MQVSKKLLGLANARDFETRWCMFFGGLKFVGVTLEHFWEQIMFKGSPVKFFVKIVARGNAVQIYSNFPAKRLSIYMKKNCHTF